MLKWILYVGAGGFLGSVSRFLVSRYVQQAFLSAFPWGTFIVNIAGCLLIGILFGIFERSGEVSPEWRMFLVAGFCGGFTTFSSFTLENITLLRDGDYFYFFLYTGLSVILGLAATFGGILLIKNI
jgi:fluoride exporter